MVFVQEYSRKEKHFGNHTLRFVVSDVYDDLFKTNANLGITESDYVDIFNIGNVKQKLNTDDGYYAADELPITVDSGICKKEKEINALNFILESVNLNKNRYCVLFFNPDYSTEDNLLDSIWFLGKISDKISGEDLKLSGIDYDENIDPTREYEFTAYSFDVSLFKDIKIKEKFTKDDGTEVRALFDKDNPRITEADINSLFSSKLFYGLKYEDLSTQNYYLKPLASLYDVLDLILNKSSDILNEQTNTPLTIDLIPTSLGLSVNPTDYDFNDYSMEVNKTKSSYKRIELKLNPIKSDLDAGWSNPFIHRRMLNPEIGQPKDGEGNFTTESTHSLETSLSFWQYDNLTELLSDIARSFGAFPFIQYKSGKIELRLISRKGLINNEFTKIIDWTNGNQDTSSILNQNDIEFKAQSTVYTIDGNDSVEIFNDWTIEPPIQRKLSESNKLNELKENSKNNNYTFTLFSSGYTLAKSVRKNFQGTTKDKYTEIRHYPLNISSINNPASLNYDGSLGYYELLHNSIYSATYPLTPEQNNILGSTTKIWRPINKVYAEINAEVIEKDTLTEMVNYLLAKDKQYYETEYEITVPFWNGFKTDTKAPSWKNIKLGSKIRLTENNKKIWNETSQQFENITDTKDYIVIDIERNSNYPETKFKLHNISRFTVNPVISDTGSIELHNEAPEQSKEINPNNFKTFQCGEIITEGVAVMLKSDGKVYLAKPVAENYGNTIGIAIQTGNKEDNIKVQTNGIYENESMNLLINSKYYVRALATPSDNISENILQPNEISENENMISQIGTAVNPHSLKLQFEDLIYE